MGERSALLCSPSNIQKLLKTHPPLNNPLWVASDTTLCNMSGFNSYPGTPLTPGAGGNREQSFVSLAFVVTLSSVSPGWFSWPLRVGDNTGTVPPGASCSVDLCLCCLYSPGLLLVNYAIKRLPPARHPPGPDPFISITAGLTLGVSKARPGPGSS